MGREVRGRGHMLGHCRHHSRLLGPGVRSTKEMSHVSESGRRRHITQEGIRLPGAQLGSMEVLYAQRRLRLGAGQLYCVGKTGTQR